MNSKRYIVLMFIILIFLLIMFLVFGIDYIKNNNKQTTIIVGDSTIWSLSKNRWYNQTDYSDVTWKNFTLYDNNKKLGTYQAWKDSDKWHYFDSQKTEKKTEGKTLAIRSNNTFKIDDYAEEYLTENDEYINIVLEENGISNNIKFKSRYKVNLDYDNDGIEEAFYIISNAFLQGNDKVISIAFMVKDGSIEYLYKAINNNIDYTSGCLPYYNYFIDLSGDDRDEIILSCGRYSNLGTIDMLYEYNDDKKEFEIIISNQ